ncbi:unnamed protein product [Allacma fusca]|uniref:DUF4806 domain-containing protein n=1 Tax=Allacma fusca TaxID=39272 RepID=A0A8J2PUX6_9HEXA|nr:unnamed protein product [Allacma fusca]
MKQAFYILRFTKDNSVEVVPSAWLICNGRKLRPRKRPDDSTTPVNSKLIDRNQTDNPSVQECHDAERVCAPLSHSESTPGVEDMLFWPEIPENSVQVLIPEIHANNSIENIGSYAELLPLTNQNFQVQNGVEEILEEIKRLAIENRKECCTDDVIIPGVCIPINTPDEFFRTNEWLQNSTNKAKLASEEKTVDFVNRILMLVVGPDLAKSTNCNGANNKIKFKNYTLLECIKVAIKKHPEDPTPSEYECESIVSKWFPGASDRNGGRKERVKKKMAVAEQNVPQIN